MLLLARRVGQALRIGADIEVRVLEIGDGQVRLGITAPRRLSVHREEIYRAILETNRTAAAASPEVVVATARTLLADRGAAGDTAGAEHAPRGGRRSSSCAIGR